MWITQQNIRVSRFVARTGTGLVSCPRSGGLHGRAGHAADVALALALLGTGGGGLRGRGRGRRLLSRAGWVRDACPASHGVAPNVHRPPRAAHAAFKPRHVPQTQRGHTGAAPASAPREIGPGDVIMP